MSEYYFIALIFLFKHKPLFQSENMNEIGRNGLNSF